MSRVTSGLLIAVAFAAGLLLGGFVLAASTWALLLAAVAAVVLSLVIGLVSEYEHRVESERERRAIARSRRLHSQHPLSSRYGGDQFDIR